VSQDQSASDAVSSSDTRSREITGGDCMTSGQVMAVIPSVAPLVDRTDDLYLKVLKDLIATKIMNTSMRVLVVCGGTVDKDTLVRAGFTDFVVSNLDENGAGYLGEKEWSYQDAEALTYPDNCFDFCVVHHGLHHCRSPHKGISEMFRVAKGGMLVFEPADNYFTSVGVRLGFGQDYEHAAVFSHNYQFGGIRNSPIPNYIYRFTAQELRKTILCLEPTMKIKFQFVHYFQVPWAQLKFRKSRLKKTVVTIALPMLKVAKAILPQIFANQIVGVALKPQDEDGLHPWLMKQDDEITPNKVWFVARYGRESIGIGKDISTTARD
jgi:ubiquinone/menaquinone biosynthesis C-methylase UbiE